MGIFTLQKDFATKHTRKFCLGNSLLLPSWALPYTQDSKNQEGTNSTHTTHNSTLSRNSVTKFKSKEEGVIEKKN